MAAGLARVAAVIDRITADVDELARARRVQDLATAAVLPGPRAERRRRLAEPDLEFRAFCTRRRLPASLPCNTPATGSGPGRLAGRAIPARRDQPTARLHRQPVPATLTTTPRHSATRAVQETGRFSGADGSIVTGTPRHRRTIDLAEPSRLGAIQRRGCPSWALRRGSRRFRRRGAAERRRRRGESRSPGPPGYDRPVGSEGRSGTGSSAKRPQRLAR